MQIRISIIAGIALNGLLAERHPFIAPSFRPFIAFEGYSSRTEIQLDVKYIYTYVVMKMRGKFVWKKRVIFSSTRKN